MNRLTVKTFLWIGFAWMGSVLATAEEVKGRPDEAGADDPQQTYFMSRDGGGGPIVESDSDTDTSTPKSIRAKAGTSNLVVNGNACIGDSCLSLSDADFFVLKLKSARPNLRFDDIGDAETNRSPHDWGLLINPSGVPQFSIGDFESSTLPFSLAGNAPDNSLFVSSSGNVGIGTASPAAPLHVSRASGGILEGILLSNNNEARISLQNTNLSVKYILAVNNFASGEFFISREGGGGTILEVNRRLDGGGAPSVNVNGSLQATNVIFSSSRDLKTEIAPLDGRQVLARLAMLPISEWRFKAEEGPVHHIGPMAEDFQKAFGVGTDDKHISATDANGIALAAIQGLNAQLRDKDLEIAELRARIEALERPASRKPRHRRP
jgi:Chaperone of endosialidase